MDREAAKQALAGFLSDRTLGANQIDFVNLIVNHLTDHGVMDARRLYESPFTDLTPQGPEGLFSPADVDEVFEALRAIDRRRSLTLRESIDPYPHTDAFFAHVEP
jgi:type I restriction enzyme, R subunit